MKGLLLAAFLALLSPSPQRNTGQISGTIVVSEKAIPVSGAEIRLSASINDPLRNFLPSSTTSDKDGHFSIPSVLAGTYSINASAPGMVRALSDSTLERMLVTVESGKETSNVVITMSPQTAIEGHVTDPDGQPSWGAQIFVRSRDGQPRGSARVDENGDFKVTVQPGQMVVSADYAPAETDSLKTYYPGVTDFASAIPLNLSEGDVRSGVSFRMQIASRVRVSGSITDPLRSGTVVDGRVFLEPQEAQRTDFSPSVPVAVVPGMEKLLFEFENIRSGDYTLFAVLKDDGGRSSLGRIPLNIGADNISGLVVSVRPGVDVRGHIAFSGTRAPDDPMLLPVLLGDLESLPGVIRDAIQVASKVDSNSDFTISNVPPGEYIVQLSGSSKAWALIETHAGTKRLVNNKLTISGDSPDLLNLTVGPAATISGTVLGFSGKPVARAPVWLLPEKALRRTNTKFRLQQADANGKFTLYVSPGNYTVISIPTEDTGEIERNESLGYSVSVMSGDSININLTTVPIPAN
jgi:hypothetical protein